jgi:hypothetical protein
VYEYFRKEIALLESASAAASDVTNAMMSVKVELGEKKKTNELLQRTLVCLLFSYEIHFLADVILSH